MTKKKTIVFISGNFNVIHPGHIRLFQFAKSIGTKLIVAVNGDNIDRKLTLINEKLRLEGISSINLVDEALILKISVQKFLKKIKPDIVLKGKEFEGQYNQEEKILKEYGGKIVFSSGEFSLSSSILIQKDLDFYLNKIKKPSNFIKRNKISFDKIKKAISKFRHKKVCIFGDLIVDRYINCEPIGMSQEVPIVTMRPITNENFLGGAGIVAAHSAALGAATRIYSVIGNDLTGKFIKQKFKDYNVNHNLYLDDSRPTTLKTRFQCENISRFKLSDLSTRSISSKIQKKIINDFKKRINEFDAIIFSDFNYGFLTNNLINEITEIAINEKKMIIADCQSSSQIGDISKYKNINLLTPTEREARLALKDQNISIPLLIEKLRDITRSKYIILKMGADGILIDHLNSNGHKVTEKLESLSMNTADVTGAGDSLLIASTLSLLSGLDIISSSYVGSVAAAIQVGRIGNIPINHKEILESI